MRKMAARLAHRGPDAEGYWTEAAYGLGFGHKRLAVVDLSPAGSQPMVSACERYVLAFNGEIYNHLDLRKELRPRAQKWRGTSDTETLLNAISAWGLERALARCSGMFALALWDRSFKQLHLARDRFGEKPLYYGWQNGVFLFASELKALRAHPGFNAEISRHAAGLFFRQGNVPAPFSIYEGTAKLAPGSLLCVDPKTGETTTKSYWSLVDIAARGQRDLFDGETCDATDHLEGLLSRSVASQMTADVPTGAFLSGGIDSSTIVALMQQHSEKPVKTFSIGFSEAGYNEAPFAKEIAAHLGTDHTEHYVTAAEACKIVPELPKIYDEPFSDASQIPTLLLSQLARNHVTVALSGDGADEIFGGYDRYLAVERMWKKISWVPYRLRKAVAAFLRRVPSRMVTVFVSLLARKLTRPQEKIAKIIDILGAPDVDAVYMRLCEHWPEQDNLVLHSAGASNARYDATLSGFNDAEHRMMLRDSIGYLADDVLVKTDRAAMASGLETRVPFLDHHVAEFAWTLPLSMKIRNGQSKRVLRQVLDKHLPSHFFARPKMGFGAPVGQWLRGPLKDWAEDLLSETRLRREGFLDPVPIRQKWHEHLSGARNWHDQIWDVVMFQAWLEEQRT